MIGKRASPAAVIGYVRVSTAEQASEGISLADQRLHIAAHCEAEGLALLRIEDRGLSGESNNGRHALGRALESLRHGEASALVAVKLDRLSRNIRDVIALVERAEREGWALRSLEARYRHRDRQVLRPHARGAGRAGARPDR